MVSRAERSALANWWWTVDSWLLAAIGTLLFAGGLFWMDWAASEGLTTGDTGWTGVRAAASLVVGIFVLWQGVALILAR